MGGSFQDQLLKLGLVDKKQVEKAKKSQHQKRKKKKGKSQPPPVDENKLLAEEAAAKKKERARQLNLEREEKLRLREIQGTIKQLIEQNRFPKNKDGTAYRFTDNKKIFRIYIDQELVDRLSRGEVGIVRLGEQYEVCPVDTVRKIQQLDAKVVVQLNAKSKKKEDDKDDPYADYEVPDDLMW